MENFWFRMNAKIMGPSIEVFRLDEVKNFKLVKPVAWQGNAEEQQYLFEHIVARYLWKHTYECLPETATPVQKLTLFRNNFAVDIASGWPTMIKTFLKCVSAFGVLEPSEIFEQKTIHELLKIQYHYFFNMQRKKDVRFGQVYELVDLVYFKTMETLFNGSVRKMTIK
jgi:hypothetical protein